MSADLSILTGAKGHKQIRTTKELGLELYYATTRVDLLKDDLLMAKPLER